MNNISTLMNSYFLYVNAENLQFPRIRVYLVRLISKTNEHCSGVNKKIS